MKCVPFLQFRISTCAISPVLIVNSVTLAIQTKSFKVSYFQKTWGCIRARFPLIAPCKISQSRLYSKSLKSFLMPSAIFKHELPSKAWVLTTLRTLVGSTAPRMVSTNEIFLCSIAYIRGVFPLFLSCRIKKQDMAMLSGLRYWSTVYAMWLTQLLYFDT